MGKFDVTILGARGSIPVSGRDFVRYGGATTCVLARALGQYIVLDAGSGLMNLPAEAMERDELSLLLSHPHLDHLLGLPLCPYVLRQGTRLNVYAVTRGGLDAKAQVERMMSPPLWPVGPELLPGEIRFHELRDTMHLGRVTVDVMEGNHPGGVSLLRLDADGLRLVFATDCTLDRSLASRLAEFERDCDLLLCDGQYRDDEWTGHSTFGHNSWEYVARFARDCGVKRLRIIHHDPGRTDDDLDRASEQLRAIGPDYAFAREGECISL